MATPTANMEVLVFNETGISEVSRDSLVKTLRAILAPDYTISDINQTELQGGHRIARCALLVLPHCTTAAPYQSLAANATAVQNIRQFIGEGGACLGICGGAYFASSRVDWGGQVQTNSTLALTPGASRGPHLQGGPQIHELIIPFLATPHDASSPAQEPYCDLYCDSGGEFEPRQSSQILAQYATSSVAAIQYTYGHGGVALWHPHLEYSFLGGPARQLYGRAADARMFRALETQRFVVIENTLNNLGVMVPDVRGDSTLTPLPQLLVVSPFTPHRIAIESEIQQKLGQPPHTIIGDREEFDIQPLAWVTQANWTAAGNRRRNTWVMSMGVVPPPHVAPLFDFGRYFTHLRDVRRRNPSVRMVEDLGDTILYGERVMSTQMQLSRNQRVLNSLPSPLLSLATFQLRGVSRNQQRWFSPYGVLQWSLLLEVPKRLDRQSPHFTIDSITQLVGLTVVEVCRQYLPAERRSELALKWPNDIYANYERDPVKIGGIVVDVFPCPGPDQKHRVLIGCGLNVHNCPPLASLSQLAGQELTMEGVAAELMVGLAIRWYEFVRGGGAFDNFVVRYHGVWLHSGHEGFIRLNDQNTAEPCTFKKLDSTGKLVVGQTRKLGHRSHYRELAFSLRDYSLEMSQMLIHPRQQNV